MTRKDTRNASALRGIAPFIAVLTVMIALAALAQTRGASQPSGKSNVAPVSTGESVTLLAQERPLLLGGGGDSERTLQSRVRRKRPSARPTIPSAPLFLPAVSYNSGGAIPDSVVVADVNGDGKPDLLVANSGSSTVGVLLGNGDGTFQAAISYGSGGFNESPQLGSVAAADVNGDGRVDLVVTNTCMSSNDCSTGTVGVLLGNGDGTFQPVVIYGSGAPVARSVAIADLNGDGKLDLAVANCGNSSRCPGDGVVGVLLGNGDGTFQAAVTYDSGRGLAFSVAIGDVNGDDKPDILVANGSGRVGVLLGNGDGSFRAAVGYKSLNAQAVAVADANGDSKPDLVTANSQGGACSSGDGSVGVLLGNGDGTFQPEVSYDSGGCLFIAVSVAVADINGDGKPDLLVPNYCASGGCSANGTVVGVLLGNGDGTFQSVVTSNAGVSFAVSLAVADLNGDGAPDVVVAQEGGVVSVLLNATGARTLTTTTLVSAPNPSDFGQAITLTAEVSSSSGTPAGTVTFFDGASELGSTTLSAAVHQSPFPR